MGNPFLSSPHFPPHRLNNSNDSIAPSPDPSPTGEGDTLFPRPFHLVTVGLGHSIYAIPQVEILNTPLYAYVHPAKPKLKVVQLSMRAVELQLIADSWQSVCR